MKVTPSLTAHGSLDVWSLMDLSLSMPSQATPAPTTPAPTLSPQPTPAPTRSMAPSATPSLSAAPSLSVAPSFAPSLSAAPSVSFEPSFVPTVTPDPTGVEVPSLLPTFQPSPTLFLGRSIFGCPQDNLTIAEPPFTAVTVVDITVGYVIETQFFLDQLQADLERLILEAALKGALQCNGPLPEECEECPPVEIFTSATGADCTPEVSFCTTLETTFQVVVDGELDPDVASFLGYVTLQEEMNGGVFENAIEILDRIEYLSPLPLLPPIITPIVTQEPILARDSLGVSPWTISAVLAMSLGGLTALWVWARNRRNRNRQHLHLLEDMSRSEGP